MSYDDVKILLDFIAVVLSAIAIGFAIWTWNATRNRASKADTEKQISNIDRRVDSVRDVISAETLERERGMNAHGQRLSKIEERLNHLPTHEDIEKLHTRISEVRKDLSQGCADIAAIKASVDALVRNVDVINRAKS